jgi:CTP:molybdopterin cytidylyltransferase MocA
MTDAGRGTRALGLIAAAGSSTRMGRCKALLPFPDGRTFVEHAVSAFVAAGIAPVVVTAPDRPEDFAAIEALVGGVTGVRVRRNPRPELGLTGSIVAALAEVDAVGGAEALVLTPVDCPFFDAASIVALRQALSTPETMAAVPVTPDGARGHPIAFGAGAFDALRVAGGSGGPRAAVAAMDHRRVIEVACHPRMVGDVNTPADYLRWFGVPLAAGR